MEVLNIIYTFIGVVFLVIFFLIAFNVFKEGFKDKKRTINGSIIAALFFVMSAYFILGGLGVIVLKRGLINTIIQNSNS